MQTTELKKLTIIGEAVLESRLLEDLRRTGAKGWTISEVRGRGSRGLSTVDPTGAQIRIESIVAEGVSQRVLELLARDYFAHYAVISWVETVHVVRGDKYC